MKNKRKTWKIFDGSQLNSTYSISLTKRTDSWTRKRHLTDFVYSSSKIGNTHSPGAGKRKTIAHRYVIKEWSRSSNLCCTTDSEHFNLLRVYRRRKPYYLFPLLIFTCRTVNTDILPTKFVSTAVILSVIFVRSSWSCRRTGLWISRVINSTLTFEKRFIGSAVRKTAGW